MSRSSIIDYTNCPITINTNNTPIFISKLYVVISNVSTIIVTSPISISCTTNITISCFYFSYINCPITIDSWNLPVVSTEAIILSIAVSVGTASTTTLDLNTLFWASSLKVTLLSIQREIL